MLWRGWPPARSSAITVGLTPGHIDVALWYVLHANREQRIDFDGEEFDAVRWFALDEVPLERSKLHMARFLRKLALTRAP